MYILKENNKMTKDEIKQFLKENGPINMDGLKSNIENLKKMAESASPRFRNYNIHDVKENMLSDIVQNTYETKNNTRNPLWKEIIVGLLITVGGSIIIFLISSIITTLTIC